MHKLFIAAAVLATSSFSALAGGLATYQPAQQFTSTVSRAEVRAELARAGANGELVAGERSYVAPVQGRALSREEVRGQLDRARRNHQLTRGEFAFAPEAPFAASTQLAGR